MDASAFDGLARTLVCAASRRAALGVLLTTAGATLGLAGSDRASAQPSCTATGTRCSDETECCSGRCERRKRSGKKVCKQADRQGVCTVEQGRAHCTDAAVTCGTRSDGGPCVCEVTTRGRSFCGGRGAGECFCTSNRECERRFGKGAKCIQNGPECITCGPSGTRCVLPCPNLDPIP